MLRDLTDCAVSPEARQASAARSHAPGSPEEASAAAVAVSAASEGLEVLSITAASSDSPAQSPGLSSRYLVR